MMIKVDKKSVKALSEYIKTKFHFIRLCLEEKKMKQDFISSENKLARLFTKVLGRQNFKEFHQRLGTCMEVRLKALSNDAFLKFS